MENFFTTPLESKIRRQWFSVTEIFSFHLFISQYFSLLEAISKTSLIFLDGTTRFDFSAKVIVDNFVKKYGTTIYFGSC